MYTEDSVQLHYLSPIDTTWGPQCGELLTNHRKMDPIGREVGNLHVNTGHRDWHARMYIHTYIQYELLMLCVWYTMVVRIKADQKWLQYPQPDLIDSQAW